MNTLKIDKSFVGAIAINEGGTSIFNTVVAMDQRLNQNLIAEGVETDHQLEYLRKLGCEEIQGWLFGKAGSADRTLKVLTQSRDGIGLREIMLSA